MSDLGDVLAELPRERTQLLDNLGAIRRHVGPVTPDRSDALADHMNIRRGEVAEVVSFYSYLQLPQDCVRVCTGPVCDCLGARDLLAQAEERAESGVPVVEVPCLGHCDLAPVGTRGDTILPGMTEAAVTHAANDGPSTGLAQADETLADYERRGGLEALRAGHSNEAVLAELEASGLVGLRRRRLSHVPQVGDGRPVRRPTRRRRQRRRGRAGHDQGPLRHGAAAAPAAGGHGHRGAVRRGGARDHLSPRGVRDGACPPPLGDRRVPRGRAASARCPWRS